MSVSTIARRTFEAKRFPAGSPERTTLNANGATSEYFTSHKWHVRIVAENGAVFSGTFATKADAEAFAARR